MAKGNTDTATAVGDVNAATAKPKQKRAPSEMAPLIVVYKKTVKSPDGEVRGVEDVDLTIAMITRNALDVMEFMDKNPGHQYTRIKGTTRIA